MNPISRFFNWAFFDHWRHIDAACGAEAAREASAPGGDAGEAAREPYRKRGKRRKGKDGAGEAGAAGSPASARGVDWRIIVVLIVVAVSLSMQEYYGGHRYYGKVFPLDRSDPYWDLKGYAWWSGWRFFGYVIIPMIAICCMPGERLRDYYVSFKEFFKHLWIYVVLFVAILPAVIIASQTDAFARTYPFYKQANRSAFDLWAWEGLYVLQFFSLEFFFRGFMLRGLGRSIGSKAIFVMAVPYCMIHFGKPFPETIGAIFAGIILGTVAMRTRSIWGGVLIHVGVALTMDLLALGHCPSAESGLPCSRH